MRLLIREVKEGRGSLKAYISIVIPFNGSCSMNAT